MSSSFDKKRKLEKEAPAGILKKKKSEKKDPSRKIVAASKSRSPEPEATTSTPPKVNKEEVVEDIEDKVTKSFKDLVGSLLPMRQIQ